MSAFSEAVERWVQLERACSEARLAYEREYARALIVADGKSQEIRKAQADLKSEESLRAYQLAAIEARAAEHIVLFMRGSDPATETAALIQLQRERPGAQAR